MFFILDFIHTTVNDLVTQGNTELNGILGHISNIINSMSVPNFNRNNVIGQMNALKVHIHNISNVESLRLLYSLPNLVIHGPVIQNGCFLPYSGLLINNGHMNGSDFDFYYSGLLMNNGCIPSDFITNIENAISALRDLTIHPNNLQLHAITLYDQVSEYQSTLRN